MLKIVGTEHWKMLDEIVIIDDNNRLTKLGWMICLLDLVTDIALFAIIYKIIKGKDSSDI